MYRRTFVIRACAIATASIVVPSQKLIVAANAPQSSVPNKAIAVYVKDMHCAGCAKKISSKLYTIKGVASVKTDLQKHVAIVHPSQQQEVSLKQLWEAVEAVEFEPVKIVANQQTHTKKPLR